MHLTVHWPKHSLHCRYCRAIDDIYAPLLLQPPPPDRQLLRQHAPVRRPQQGVQEEPRMPLRYRDTLHPDALIYKCRKTRRMLQKIVNKIEAKTQSSLDLSMLHRERMSPAPMPVNLHSYFCFF